MKMIIIILSCLFGVLFGVQLDVDPSTATLSFSYLAEFTEYYQMQWTAYDSTTNRIYLIGGIRGTGAGTTPTNPNGVYYDIDSNEFVEYNVPITPLNGFGGFYCFSQDYTRIGRTTYRMEEDTLQIFDMATETGSQITVSTPPQISLAGSGDVVDNIALCSDGDRYLFAVGKQQLYVYDINDINSDPIQGPLLNTGDRQFHSCAYSNGAVYVIGGSKTSKMIEKCDIDLNNIQNVENSVFDEVITMPNYLFAHRNIVIGNYIYITGGTQKALYQSTAATAINLLQVLNTNTDTLTTNPARMKQNRFFHGIEVDLNGDIYLFGGAYTTSTQVSVTTIKNNEKSSSSIS